MTMPWVPPDLPPVPAIDPRELPQRPPRDWSWLGRPGGLFLLGVLFIALGAVIWAESSVGYPCRGAPMGSLAFVCEMFGLAGVSVGIGGFCVMAALGDCNLWWVFWLLWSVEIGLIRSLIFAVNGHDICLL
jgi:hypothetical protein